MATCSLLPLAACGKPDESVARELRLALDRTERLSREFVYEEVADDRNVAVRGVIDDDFRFKARVDVNGQPALEETVSDDAVANRLLQPALLPLFQAPSSLAVASVSADRAVDALSSGHWVLDKAGAPPLVNRSGDRLNLGADPVHDSLTVFGYVENAMRLTRVRKYDKFDLEYRPAEDPFPRPTKESGVTRYDFVRARVPRPSDAAGGNQVVPGITSFRKMAVYVKDGLVIDIREDVDVVSRLRDLSKNYNIDLNRPGLTDQEAVKIAVDAINAVLRGQGNEPIRVRKMRLQFRNVGAEASVALPTDGVIEADLSVLRGRGRSASLVSNGSGDSGGSGSSGSATTTTPSG
jgi:hypothetical protein